ncbi:MAG TPA: CRISPR-associated helicase Cas3' [Planctomycetota bacterium]|nr:CRISPR-associated helicase Cas3' [Planctomycetota bacterium]
MATGARAGRSGAPPGLRPARLLAKSASNAEALRDPELLEGHTAQVVAAADALLAVRLAPSLEAAGLRAELAPRLRAIVRLAAAIHDLGKANDQFQAMVRRERVAQQLVRHEAVSLWLAWPGQPLAVWLAGAVAGAGDYLLALAAMAGHHRKFPDHASAANAAEQGLGGAITLLASHPDFAATLGRVGDALDLGPCPAFSQDIKISAIHPPLERLFRERWADEFADRAFSDEDRRLLASAKAFMIAADVAGSALPKAGASADWIATALALAPTREDLDAVVAHRLRGSTLRPFQAEVAASAAPVTLARAGCGTGKTIAAYRWAAENHADRQLWVTYPTTGTSTEGFRDYLFAPELAIEARLEHGRVEVDLLELRGEDEKARERDRLDAIRVWGKRVIACTVDTVLGLIQNQRKGLYAWPALARGAIVFDEVHSYDDALFGALLRFLEALPGIPALLMTASLPEARLSTLRAIVARVHGRPLAEIAGPTDLEVLPRYVRRDAQDAWPAVEAALAERGKVLWVSNTVDRAIAAAERAEAQRLDRIIYHSRFRYTDRVRRHQDVIEAFRVQGPALALTTQVAEMSLDLSADLLVTDLAPVPALIQRLGRLNRRSTPENAQPVRPFIVLEVERELPYTAADLDEARAWLKRLGAVSLSQRDLVDAWRAAPTAMPQPSASAWLDGGYVTEPRPLRESSPGITVIRAADLAEARREPRNATALAIPMNPPPREVRWQDWPTVRGYFIAPEDSMTYDEKRGARWRKN